MGVIRLIFLISCAVANRLNFSVPSFCNVNNQSIISMNEG